MKVDIETIENVMVENKIPQDKITKVLQELQVIKEEEKAENAGEKLPRQKSEFGIVIFDTDGSLQGKELTGHIYQVKQGFDHANILGTISKAVRESNANTKKKKNIIDSIGDAFASLKRKYSKAENFQPKSKEIVRVTISNNKLVE